MNPEAFIRLMLFLGFGDVSSAALFLEQPPVSLPEEHLFHSSPMNASGGLKHNRQAYAPIVFFCPSPGPLTTEFTEVCSAPNTCLPPLPRTKSDPLLSSVPV